MRWVLHTLTCLLIPALASLFAATAFSQDAGDQVRVRLSLAGGKKVYRAGEPIRLVLSFTADGDGYSLDTITVKPAHPVDEILLLPDAGVTRWLDEYTGGRRYPPDVATTQKITATPMTVELPLNDWFRFDRPGRYTVRVKTRRVSRPERTGEFGPQIALTTNEVTFEVVPMSRAEEEQEVRRLSALLESKKRFEEQVRYSEELSYLSGEPSTREKVRRFLTPQDGNSAQNIYYGLFIARDRALVLRLLDGVLRDLGTPATHELLHTLTMLRALREGVKPMAPGSFEMAQAEDPDSRRYMQIQQEYLGQLAASLAKRAGVSRTTTAMTVLENLPNDPYHSAHLLGDLRKILLNEFEHLHPFAQERLLSVHWERVGDASLQPALERLLAKAGDRQSYQLRGSALMRLMEMDPERARPFVVAELRDPASAVDFDVLRALKDETLPEADASLLEQIRKLARNGNWVWLRLKALLVARYASPAIYDGLMDVYKTSGAKWQPDARGSLLGYFARHNEAQAVPLIEQALSELEPGQDLFFFNELTRSNYPEAVGDLLRKRLEGDEPQAVGTAAYVMSQHGPADDRLLIEARLGRWVKEWGGRGAELDTPGNGANVAQSMVEVNLIEALLAGKSWRLPEEKVKQLTQRCVTRVCREHYQNR